jgi:hypothetical protein
MSWLFSAFVWAGRGLMLSVLTDKDGASSSKKRQAVKAKLWLQLPLPDIGVVNVYLQQTAKGLLIDLASQSDAGLSYLRSMSTKIVECAHRAGMCIVCCRLLSAVPCLNGVADPELAPRKLLVQALAPSLFNVAVELALLLGEGVIQ